MKTAKHLKNIFSRYFKASSSNNIAAITPTCRVIKVAKNKNGDYEATIQSIGNRVAFKMRPEEILADDKMTDQFSPRDVRTLTYLGYLEANSPKYKILAKKLSKQDNRMVFALHKKGKKQMEIKTAREISQQKDIIQQIDQEDAHMVGYTAATEAMLEEQKEKEKLIES